MRRINAGVVVVSIALAGGCARMHVGGGGTDGRDTDRATDGALRVAVQATAPPAYVTRDPEGARLWKETQAFYEQRQFSPAWIEEGVPRPQMNALIDVIRAADREGLDPELYNASLLDQRKTQGAKGFLSRAYDPDAAGVMDVWLTYLYMKYASDLADGLSDLAHADPTWQIKTEAFDPRAQLERALSENRVAESLTELTPSDPEYRALRKILADYRQQAARGGWPPVPSGMKLKPGQQSADVADLARRLAASGDYQGTVPPEGQPAEYDSELQEAVKRFQRRHGLTDDGAVGPGVTAEMNVPIDARIRQIELSMERWRWLPRDLGDPHIIVNIPEMRMDVWDHGKVPVSMRVVVGKQGTPTPIFNDEMTHIVFSPYWNVPSDIAKNETLPSILKDPGFLDRTNMEVTDGAGRVLDPSSIDLSSPGKYRFRQRPGTSNSLGLVKFMFPNQFNVYLHDTPVDSLFARASRSFSHGCVRLEQPEKLAEYVLRDQPEWSPERINGAMHAGAERTVKLKTPIPVYLGYWTARVAPDGMVQFRKDVYGIDGRQTTKLAERLGQMRTSAMAAASAMDANAPVGTGGKR